MPSTVRLLVRLHFRVRLWKTAAVRQVASIATGRQKLHCRMPSTVRFLARLHFDRSRQTGRRRQGRRLVVIASAVSSVVVTSVVSAVVVGTA